MRRIPKWEFEVSHLFPFLAAELTVLHLYLVNLDVFTIGHRLEPHSDVPTLEHNIERFRVRTAEILRNEHVSNVGNENEIGKRSEFERLGDFAASLFHVVEAVNRAQDDLSTLFAIAVDREKVIRSD